MGVKLNLIGQRFGKLLVREEAGKTNQGIYQWLCICDCGNLTIVRVTSLTPGNTSSCGCGIGNATRVPKKYKTLPVGIYSNEYDIWSNIKNRCYNSKNIGYKNYGGRGISMSDNWKNSFECFFNDMGRRPSKEHSIDRIDVNGNYEVGNCRWATRKEQAENKRSNRYLEYNGRRMTLSNWAREFGVHSMVLHNHLKKRSLKEVHDFYKEKSGKEKSRFLGVFYEPEKRLWRVKITVNKTPIYAGRFRNKFKAALKYNEVALNHFGENAVLNILTEEEVSLAHMESPRRIAKNNNTGYFDDIETAIAAHDEAIVKNNFPCIKLINKCQV